MATKQLTGIRFPFDTGTLLFAVTGLLPVVYSIGVAGTADGTRCTQLGTEVFSPLTA